jgi:hypothetical protein
MQTLNSTYIILKIICSFIMNYKNIMVPHSKFKFIRIPKTRATQFSMNYTYMQLNIYVKYTVI